MINDKRTHIEIQSQNHCYEIRLKGLLDHRWADWFKNMTITQEADGNTLLSGPVVDQAALLSLIKKLRDVGLPLVSINQIQSKEANFNKLQKEIETNPNTNPLNKDDPKALVSALWSVVMLNMVTADVLSLFIPGATDEMVKTSTSTGTPIPYLMLGGAVVLEIVAVMIVLPHLVKAGVNRWVNLIVSLITVLFVVGGGVSYPHYIFLAILIVLCLLAINWVNWKNAHTDAKVVRDNQKKSQEKIQ